MSQSVRSFGRAALIRFLLLISYSSLLAQDAPRARETDESTRWKVGTELDPTPFLTGGYYGSAFLGYEGWRFRGVAARMGTPNFQLASGFERQYTNAYGLLLDRFVGSNKTQMKGLWFGGGAEYWQSRVRQEHTSAFTHYDNVAVTAGGGYVWKLSSHFYLNSWSGMAAIVSGNRKINVSGKTYQQPLLTPEISVKFGFVF